MIAITCPACARRYAINMSDNMQKSRKMRCGKCRYEWIFDFETMKNEKFSTFSVDKSQNSLIKIDENDNYLKKDEHIVSHGTIFPKKKEKNAVYLDKKIRQSIMNAQRKSAQINLWVHALVMSCFILFCCTTTMLIFYEDLPNIIRDPMQAKLVKTNLNIEKINNFQLENVDIQQDLTGKIKVSGKIRNLTDENHTAPKLRLILKDQRQKKKIMNLHNDVKIIEQNGFLEFAYEILDINAEEAIIELGNSLRFFL